MNIICFPILRYGILKKRLDGKLILVNMNKVKEWRENLKSCCEGFEPKIFYNNDKTSLVYRALRNRSLATNLKICRTTKLVKTRLIILFYTNATEDHQHPLVIGSYKHPCCFGMVDAASLTTQWAFNCWAWITVDLFKSWLIKLDNRFKRDKRKVLLFLNNASSHPNIKREQITLRFLPHLCTAAVNLWIMA